MESLPRRPRYLTATETVFSCILYAGVGYLVAGWMGLGCGIVLLLVLMGRQIWLSSQSEAD